MLSGDKACMPLGLATFAPSESARRQPAGRSNSCRFPPVQQVRETAVQPGLASSIVMARASLRHRPDRLIVGETRGPEALDLLSAMNTGHDGSFTTIHAHAVGTVPDRLATCALQAGDALPYDGLIRQIAQCVQWIVHVERAATDHAGGRRVARELACVDGIDAATRQLRMTTVERYEPHLCGHSC